MLEILSSRPYECIWYKRVVSRMRETTMLVTNYVFLALGSTEIDNVSTKRYFNKLGKEKI